MDEDVLSRSLDAVAEKKLTLDDEGANDTVSKSLEDADDKLVVLGIAVTRD